MKVNIHDGQNVFENSLKQPDADGLKEIGHMLCQECRMFRE